ncbi:hypothetical protein [Lederbergia ruris]|uniref:hypothetical protein n=1 Tax=Lederbergia ruris TaxID=217495 RepID=UPI0039A08941
MMPLQLPTTFDENEWFIIIGLILSYSLILWLPKRFPLSLTILLLLFGSTVARIYDHLLSSPDLNLYNIMDSRKYELFDVISYFLYAPFSYLYIYFYEKLNVRGFWILLYIVISSIIGTLFEGVNALFHVFNYHGWKLSYSFSVYLGVQALTLLFYHMIKHFHHRQTTNK